MSHLTPANANESIVPPSPVTAADYFPGHTHELQRRSLIIGGQEHVFHSIATSPQSDVHVTWPGPAGLAAGRYQLAVFVPRSFGTTRAARYFVHGAVAPGGVAGPVVCPVDQLPRLDEWAVLGTFTFDPAQDADIYVDAQNFSAEAPAREMSFDAIRWRRVPDIDFPFHALAGVHGPAEPRDGAWTAGCLQAVQQAGMAAVKAQVCNQDPLAAATTTALRGMTRFVMARLWVPLGDLPAGPGNDPFTFFFQEIDGGTRALARALAAGIEYFEVLNEPNLSDEGQAIHWQNGAQFAALFVRLYDELKRRFPAAKFGFPGVSPGGRIPPPTVIRPNGQALRRYPSEDFLREAAPAIEVADFLCTHVYWGQLGETVDTAVAKLEAVCNAYPDKLVFASEFSNNAPGVDKHAKGREYLDFYRKVKNLPPNLGAVFAYCLSSAGDYPDEIWIETNGDFSGIVAELAPHAGFLRQ